ncbi:hypothetical protein D3C85_566010 [compost metagenome]
MAGKTVTDKPQVAATAAKKPGPKPGAKAAAAKPADAKPGTTHDLAQVASMADLGKDTGTFQTVKEISATTKVFLENMAHALIFDVFQMHSVLNAIRDIDEVEVAYFLDFYSSRLRPLLIDDNQSGNICALLDLGVWYALEGQEEILTEGLIERLGGDIQATPEQIKKLAIEAVYGNNRNETPSRGERWMPALHRASSREDLERVSPGHGHRSSDSREGSYTSRRNR